MLTHKRTQFEFTVHNHSSSFDILHLSTFDKLFFRLNGNAAQLSQRRPVEVLALVLISVGPKFH